MRSLTLTVVAAVAIGATSFAMAGDLSQNLTVKPNPVKHGGFYIGGAAGYASFGMPKQLFDSETSLNNNFFTVSNQKSKLSDFAANVHAGYLFSVTHKFLIGPEFDYNYLPKDKYTYGLNSALLQPSGTLANNEIKYTRYSFDLLGVAKYYIIDNLNVFGKAGASYVHQKVNQTLADGSIGVSKAKSKIQPKFALGLGYNVTQHVELTVEYDHTFGDKVNQSSNVFANGQPSTLVNPNKIPSSNEVLVGLNYYF